MIAVENFGDTVALSAGGPPPALLTSTSIRPKRSIGEAARPCRSRRGRARRRRRTPPSRPPPAGSVSGSLRQQITTSAPAARKRSAMPRPTPRQPPVTIDDLARESRVGRSCCLCVRHGPESIRDGASATLAGRDPIGGPRPRRGGRHRQPARERAARRGLVRARRHHPPRSAATPRSASLIVAANPELRAFQVGVDIKELAADPTKQSLIGVNRGCWETFAAVYDCEVPVIAAVHGFCLGGGVGIAGNADIVVAADDAQLRPPRGRPGRARRRHPPVAPRAPAQDAGDVPHGLDDHGAAAARVRERRAGRAARRADGRGARDRGRRSPRRARS